MSKKRKTGTPKKSCSRDYLKPVVAVARVTLQEIIRDKILYNILLCAALLMGVALLAARLSVTRQERIVQDFGLTAVSLSCVAIAIFTGCSLIGREFDRRTIFVALSRPITRFQFILGKFGGLCGVLTLNWAMLSVVYLVILGVMSGSTGWALFSSTLFWAIGLVLLQSLVLSSIAFVFSSFTTTSLAVIITVGFYLIGNNISQLRLLAAKSQSAFSSSALIWLSNVFPNLENFNLGLKVSYSLPVTWEFVALAIGYGFIVIAIGLFLTGLLIKRREA